MGHALGKGERRDAGDADGLYALVRVSLPPDLGKAPAFRGAWVAPAHTPRGSAPFANATQEEKSWAHGGGGCWPFGTFGASHNPPPSTTDARANSETVTVRSIVFCPSEQAASATALDLPRLLVSRTWQSLLISWLVPVLVAMGQRNRLFRRVLHGITILCGVLPFYS